MVRTTTALTIFNAGDKDNVLPGNAAATVNFRLLPGDTQASVVDHVRSTINNDLISVDPFAGNTDPPPVTGTASPSFKMLNRTIREIFPDVVVAPGLMVAATDSRHYTEITDKIFRFSPVRANSDDLKRFHGTNERLSIEGYADMIRFYRRLIENAAGGGVSAPSPRSCGGGASEARSLRGGGRGPSADPVDRLDEPGGALTPPPQEQASPS